MSYERRVMSKEPASFIAAEDVEARAYQGKVGRVFEMVVDEYALAQMGKEAMIHVASKLGERAAHDHRHLIESTVRGYILDREWVEPIIRQIMRETIDSIFRDMFESEVSP